MIDQDSLKERTLRECFKIATFFHLRENARLHDKMDDVAIHDAHLDFELDQLKKLMDEMDGML